MKHDASRLIDGTVLVVVGALAVVGAGVRADPSDRTLAAGLAAASAAVLVFRRRAPALTLVASGGFVLALLGVDHAAAAIAVVAPAAALYSFVLVRRRTHVLIGTVAVAAAVVLGDVFVSGHAHTLTLQTVGHAALVAVPVLAGEALRNHRSNVQLLVERVALAERTREEEAQRRAEQERLRIARELHDVVAHTLTTINVQAGVARHLLNRQPENVEGALATIESASHNALQELRALVRVLREPGEETAPLAPTPGLATVEALIEQVRGDGEVRFHVVGQAPNDVPEAVQQAAYRIVQESLTNTRRHAPGTPAEVTIAFTADRIKLTIENTALGSGGETRDGTGIVVDGTGIVGMRERAAALGGNLAAGQSDGRFRVAAELPYRGVA